MIPIKKTVLLLLVVAAACKPFHKEPGSSGNDSPLAEDVRTETLRAWEAYVKYNIEHKLLFASDHPLVHWNKIVPATLNLPISEGFKGAILYKNAKKLLKI